MPRPGAKFVKSFGFNVGANIFGIELVRNLLSNGDAEVGNVVWEGFGDLLLLLFRLASSLLSIEPFGLWFDEFVFDFLEFFISPLPLFGESFPKDDDKELGEDCGALWVVAKGDTEDDGLVNFTKFEPFSNWPVIKSLRGLCLESK